MKKLIYISFIFICSQINAQSVYGKLLMIKQAKPNLLSKYMKSQEKYMVKLLK
jgi:hypothetical protein